jgi:hypothetical protein
MTLHFRPELPEHKSNFVTIWPLLTLQDSSLSVWLILMLCIMKFPRQQYSHYGIWVLTPHSLVRKYWLSAVMCCLHLQCCHLYVRKLSVIYKRRLQSRDMRLSLAQADRKRPFLGPRYCQQEVYFYCVILFLFQWICSILYLEYMYFKCDQNQYMTSHYKETWKLRKNPQWSKQ